MPLRQPATEILPSNLTPQRAFACQTTTPPISRSNRLKVKCSPTRGNAAPSSRAPVSERFLILTAPFRSPASIAPDSNKLVRGDLATLLQLSAWLASASHNSCRRSSTEMGLAAASVKIEGMSHYRNSCVAGSPPTESKVWTRTLNIWLLRSHPQKRVLSEILLGAMASTCDLLRISNWPRGSLAPYRRRTSVHQE